MSDDHNFEKGIQNTFQLLIKKVKYISAPTHLYIKGSIEKVKIKIKYQKLNWEEPKKKKKEREKKKHRNTAQITSRQHNRIMFKNLWMAHLFIYKTTTITTIREKKILYLWANNNHNNKTLKAISQQQMRAVKHLFCFFFYCVLKVNYWRRLRMNGFGRMAALPPVLLVWG